MGNNETNPQAVELAQLFAKTFGAPSEALKFFLEMFKKICYYHDDPELARDSSFALEVFSKEMVFDVLESSSIDDIQDRIHEGAEQVLCFLDGEVLTNAGKYMRRAVYAYGKENGFAIEDIEDDVEKTDFFFEAGVLSEKVEASGEVIDVKYKPQNTNDDARS